MHAHLEQLSFQCVIHNSEQFVSDPKCSLVFSKIDNAGSARQSYKGGSAGVTREVFVDKVTKPHARSEPTCT